MNYENHGALDRLELLVLLMSKFDYHESRAKISALFRPIIEDVNKIERRSGELLRELGSGNLKEEFVTQLIEDLSELEYMYDKLMDSLDAILQDVPLESRIAKETLNALRKIKEIFEDTRLKIENIKGFIKPNIPLDGVVLREIVEDANKSIARLRSTLLNDLSKYVRSIVTEYMKFESFLSSDFEIER